MKVGISGPSGELGWEGVGLAQPVGVPVTCCGHQVPSSFLVVQGGSGGSGSGSNSGGGSTPVGRKRRGRSPAVLKTKDYGQDLLSPVKTPQQRKARKRKISAISTTAPTAGVGLGQPLQSKEMFLLQAPFNRNYPLPTTFEFLVRNYY